MQFKSAIFLVTLLVNLSIGYCKIPNLHEVMTRLQLTYETDDDSAKVFFKNIWKQKTDNPDLTTVSFFNIFTNNQSCKISFIY